MYDVQSFYFLRNSVCQFSEEWFCRTGGAIDALVSLHRAAVFFFLAPLFAKHRFASVLMALAPQKFQNRQI